jgi:outer membrane PBP1 activator LpoA protein
MIKKSLVIYFCLLFLVSACAPPTKTSTESPLARQARQLEQEQRFPEAAQLWLQLAQTQGELSAYLPATEAWIAAEQWQRAQTTLSRADSGFAQLSEREQQHYWVLKAEIAMEQHRYDRARSAMARLPERIDSSWRRRAERINTQLAQLAQGPAARQLNRLLSLPENNAAQITPNFVDLATLPTAELTQLRQLRTNARELAWLDLAIAARHTLIARQDSGAVMSQWWNQHANAGPNPEQATKLVVAFHRSFTYPQKIAVLLPLSGSFEAAGKAIRNGLLAAWSELPSAQRPQLDFIALNDSPESATGALLEAHEGQYDWIIGPLRRETVNTVLQFPGSTIPLLLLNRPDAGIQAPAGLPVYSFALLPEDDAAASAQQALNAGHHSALVLHSDDSWGQRVAQAFTDAFTFGGGQVLHSERFNPKESNHSVQLRTALGLNEANARQRRMRSLLGVPVGFEPVPRQDIDMIFLGARVVQARQLRPQLRFFDAGELPIFATSQVYSGRNDPRNDRDLDDVQFPSAPWLLDQGQQQPAKSQLRQWFAQLDSAGSARLFALGMDVMAVLPYLSFMQNDPNAQLAGAHGQLSVDPQGLVLRALQASQFVDGSVELMPNNEPNGTSTAPEASPLP